MEHTPDYLLVVVEESASHVGVYDPVTGLRRSTIKLGFLPHEIALSGDGKIAYVSNFGLQDYDETIGVPGYSVSIVDLERAVETGRLYTFNEHGLVLKGPHGVKLRPTYRELFVNAEIGEQILVFDIDTGQVLRTLTGAVASNQPVANFPVPEGTHNFVFSADGSALYILTGPQGVYKLDPNTGATLAQSPVATPIHGLAFLPDQSAIIASGVNEIVLLAPGDLSVLKKFENLGVGQLLYSVPTNDGKRIVAPAVWDSQTLVIDAVTGAVLARIVTGIDPVHVVISPDDRFAYISNARSCFVSQIDLASYALRQIETAQGPNGLAIAPSFATVPRNKLHFGAVLPLSGALSASGREVATGYQYWMECVNDAGGISIGSGVYEVELLLLDNGSDATLSNALTEKLISSGVQFMLGGYPTPSDQAAGPVVNDKKIPMVGAGSAGNVVYGPQNRYVFGLLPPATGYLAGSIDVMTAQHPAPKTFVILSSDDPAALEDSVANSAYAVQKGLTQLTITGTLPQGIERVQAGILVYHEGLTDFSAAMAAIQALKPDLFFTTGHEPASVAVVQASAKLGFTPMGIGIAVGPALPIFVSAVGSLAANLMGPGVWIPQLPYLGLDRFGTATNFALDYYNRYNLQASYLSAGAVACGLVYEDALRRAGTVAPAAVRDALAATSLDTFYGPIAFGATGQSDKKPLVTFQIQQQNQKLTNVVLAPLNLAPNAVAVWPFPGWKSRGLGAATFKYSNANLSGHYWFNKIGGIPSTDALGTINFDGAGNFAGDFVLNVAGTVTPMTYKGTYSINLDGTGLFTWVRHQPNGMTQTLNSHVVALQAAGGFITQIYSSIDAPDPETGELSGRMIYRQPD